MDDVNLSENTQDHDIKTENIAQSSESSSLSNSVGTISIKEQKIRKKCKNVSEEKGQSLENKKQRENANARNRKYLSKMTDAQREECNRKKREAYQKKKNLNLVQGLLIACKKQRENANTKNRKYLANMTDAQRNRENKEACQKKKDLNLVKDQSLAYKKQREKANARNRKYLANMTDEQREEKNRKKREAYQRKKELNLIKSINDLTPRQQQEKRKYWRGTSAKYRKQKRQLEGVMTPESQINSEPSCSEHSGTFENMQMTPLISQKKRGEKACEKNSAQILKEIQEKDKTILELQRKIEMLQKSLQKKNSSSTRNLRASSQPNKKN